MDRATSGGGRTALTDDATDFYPVPLKREALWPGTVYADPYGHTLMIVKWVAQTPTRAGMLLAVDLSRRLGWLAATDVERVRTLLTRSGLPTVAPLIGTARALELMGMDKKVLAGRIRLVLTKRLGEGIVTGDYPADALTATLESHFGAAA